ncbi:MAG: hypothetical protein ABF289_15510 [Clostridiales bacterium]
MLKKIILSIFVLSVITIDSSNVITIELNKLIYRESLDDGSVVFSINVLNKTKIDDDIFIFADQNNNYFQNNYIEDKFILSNIDSAIKIKSEEKYFFTDLSPPIFKKI